MGSKLTSIVALLFLATPAAAQPLSGCESASGSPLADLFSPIAMLTRNLEPALPACSSDLMRAVHADAAPHATEDNGGTDPSLFTTSANSASPNVLVKGPEIGRAMTNAIANAKEEVTFETFVFKKSPAAQSLLDGLTKLEANRKASGARAPVRVHILVNRAPDTGLIPFVDEKPMEVEDAVKALGLDPRYVDVEIKPYKHKGLGASHNKSLVVDGKTAIVTGMNMQPQKNSMDTGYTLEGDVARAIRSQFEDAWGESLPPLRRSGAPAVAGACAPMMVTTRKANGFLSNDTGNTASKVFLSAFENAKSTIRIFTPNINDDAVRSALVDAMARGVKVELLVSKGFNDSTENPFGGTNEEVVAALYRDLEKRGVPASRLDARWYSHDGRTAIDGNVPHASHTKYTSIDGQLVIVGSSNMDTQSWNHSREMNVAIDSKTTTRTWDGQLFEPAFDRAISARQ